MPEPHFRVLGVKADEERVLDLGVSRREMADANAVFGG
jgi:hypothetical protein